MVVDVLDGVQTALPAGAANAYPRQISRIRFKQMKKIDRSASVYYGLQGAAVFIWWAGVLYFSDVRALFEMGDDRAVLDSFILPDVAFLATASIAASILCRNHHEYRSFAAWFVTGLITYATAYTFAYAINTDTGWAGVALMAPATIWSGVFAIGVSPLKDRMFRVSGEAADGRILLKTFSQIVVVWSIILGVFPYFIVTVEDKLGIPRLEFAFQRVLAGMLFVLASVPGIWAAYVMSRLGMGTPRPRDHARKLVIGGPYAYVRHPMAVSGILQGLVIALFWGSALVAIYALMGSAIWQLIFRPLEEKDLEKRFGEEYLAYKNSVRCWIPGNQFRSRTNN